MSTDRELLELAAKAVCGAALKRQGVDRPLLATDWILRDDGSILAPTLHGCATWNPLTDDGDALRLAVKLRIHIEHVGARLTCDVQASPRGMGHLADVQEYGDDPAAATRRAVVRAAAEIGRTSATGKKS